MKYFYSNQKWLVVSGENTVMNRDVHPPVVRSLHYQLEGWLGDVLLESFPCFIVTEDARRKLQLLGATGATFDDVEITTSEQFKELYPNRQLPTFVWLRVQGMARHDDFGIAEDARLVV